MRSKLRFMKDVVGLSLKNVKRIEVQFDPFHPNASSVRTFYAGVTTKKRLKSNPECVFRAQIVDDNSDPLVTVQFKDDHKLILNGKYLEPSHFVQLIKEFETIHKDESEDV